MSQTTLPVRSGDPDTSYAAALKAVLGASKVRPVVLELISQKGPLTHDALISAYNFKVVSEPDTPRSSESGIRTRLKELVHAGLVVADEAKGRSNYGNRATQWVAVDPDDPRFDAQLVADAAGIGPDDVVAQADPVDGDDSTSDEPGENA